MIRRSFALDRATPLALVEVLARDPSEIVRNAAKHRLAEPRKA